MSMKSEYCPISAMFEGHHREKSLIAYPGKMRGMTIWPDWTCARKCRRHSLHLAYSSSTQTSITRPPIPSSLLAEICPGLSTSTISSLSSMRSDCANCCANSPATGECEMMTWTGSCAIVSLCSKSRTRSSMIAAAFFFISRASSISLRYRELLRRIFWRSSRRELRVDATLNSKCVICMPGKNLLMAFSSALNLGQSLVLEKRAVNPVAAF
mmetsp:Transcript_127573/g.190143  ORF Transcript_127573/g.190143 Transcript_127573/m.190143 type:complete len:212 (-) Transcript_127573:3531-4166(-)